AVAFAARKRSDPALLIASLEVEPRHVRTRRDRSLSKLHVVLAAGNLLPHRLVGAQRVAALVDVADLHGVPQAQRAAVRLLLAGDHPEQRRLAGAVRTDDADDPAAREREGQIVHQQQIAVAFAQPARLDDDVAEPRSGRDVDLDLLDLLRRVRLEQVLVRVDARLPLRVARARRHADPLQLALEGPLTFRLLFLLDREPPLLLLEPRRVVPFPRNPRPAIQLEDPAGDVVEEVPIVRDGDDGARVVLE